MIRRRAPTGLLSTDYLSERGFGLGTTFAYEQDSFLGHPGPGPWLV